MESIVVNVNTKSEGKLIKDIASKMGYSSFLLNDVEKRMIARIKLSQLTVKESSAPDISLDEIQQEINHVRAARYAKKTKKKGSR